MQIDFVLAGLRVRGAIVLGLWAGAMHGQTAIQPPAAFVKEPLVIERSDSRYHMQADGTGFRERTVVAWVQSESTLKQLSVLTVPFAANSEHVEWVYARVRHVDGSKTETPVSGAMEIVEPVTREAPFYSDLKQMQLPLKDLRVGDRLEWQAKIVRTRAEAPNEFWGQEGFTRDAVTLSETVELEVPKDKKVTVWSLGTKPVESAADDVHTYKWEWVNKNPTVGAEADAAKEVEKKRVRTSEEELDDREGKLPDIAWTTFADWPAVGAWYRGMEGDRMEPDAEIKARVAQITAGKTTEQEKVQAVYTYVATQIHYIGVAFGVGRYQPHRADDVLANQYGDCKDKHTLLASMLAALNLKPDAVLIGAGIRFNPAVPSPGAFNHLITRVDLDGKETWLDTTAEVAPFGMLTFPTRDHDALVVPANGLAKVVRTPDKAPFVQATTMKAAGTLDADGTSNSRITMTFRGDAEVLIRAVLRQISPAQYDQLAQNLCAGIGYIGTATHLETSRPEDLATPLELSFDYKREKAGDWPNLKTIPQLVPVTTARIDEKNPPVEAIGLGVTGTVVSDSEMKLPTGWGAEMPVAVHEKSPWMTYDLTYRFDKGTMYAHRQVEVLQERVAQTDWKAYGKFLEKTGIDNEEYIQLTRPAGAKSSTTTADKKITLEVTPDPSSMSASEKDVESKTLISRAYQALEAADTAAAVPLLDQAKALNPEAMGLWGNYGYLEYRKGEFAAAIKDYDKELELHPSNVGFYQPMTNAYLALRQRREAEETLRRWETAAPENSMPTLWLAGLESQDSDYAEAAKTLEAGLARTASGEKKDEQLELQLGVAQLKAGQKDKGHVTLTALLKATDNPDMMNDAAYELANAGLELPLAEQTTRTALEKMEQQSQTWTLDESAQTLRARTRMMQATWDTMGWVYFRNGKIKEAQEYIGAAWQGRQDAEVGQHLAEIEIARGDRNAALADYEMARETMPPSIDLLGVRTEPGAAQKALTAKIDALHDGGAHTQGLDPHAALIKLRTVPLGPAQGLNGVAEYKLLVSRDAILRVEPAGAKTLAGGDLRLKAAKLSAFVPADSRGQLVLAGMLNCHAKVCELILEP